MDSTIDTPAQPLFRSTGTSTLAQRGGIDLEILDLIEIIGIWPHEISQKENLEAQNN
jgi:hypothetical protein